VFGVFILNKAYDKQLLFAVVVFAKQLLYFYKKEVSLHPLLDKKNTIKIK